MLVLVASHLPNGLPLLTRPTPRRVQYRSNCMVRRQCNYHNQTVINLMQHRCLLSLGPEGTAWTTCCQAQPLCRPFQHTSTPIVQSALPVASTGWRLINHQRSTAGTQPCHHLLTPEQHPASMALHARILLTALTASCDLTSIKKPAVYCCHCCRAKHQGSPRWPQQPK